MTDKPKNHTWRFFRAGGFDQVRLETGADLMNLDQLDQKLWVALACPVAGVEFDTTTLGMIDTDKDGRIRPPELMAAIRWAGGLLKSADELVRGTAELPLAAINDATAEGQAILESARKILANLGKADAAAIGPEETADLTKLWATPFNGDGVITADSTTSKETRQVIGEIIATQGGETDRSGKPGVSQAKVDALFAEAAAFDGWHRQAEGAAGAVQPLGADTAAAFAAWQAVRAKVDDFFGRCRLAAYDARAVAALNREEKEYLAVAAKDLTITAEEVAGFPLAMVGAGQALPLTGGHNPAWAGALSAFVSKVVTPMLGARAALTESEWAAIGARFAPYEAWLGAKAGATVEPLGLDRVRAILGGKEKATLTALIAKDKAEEGNANAIALVDRLVRYHRDLHRLCINFVNFRDFYDRGEPAIFQAGVLYLDQRSCSLCLRVEDVGKHAAMAGMAGTYLAYCDCVRKGSGEKMQIVAAFTDGDSDNLMVGRNGVFYDRKGRDWDATITKIIENPISIRQAFWAPYKKFVRMIEEQIAKRAAAADTAATDKLAKAATEVAPAGKAATAAAPAPKKFDVGVIAAMGVALGAIGTFLATVFAKFVELKPIEIALVLVAVVLLISGPSMLMAYLKLRKRNLGPILDANGWAVNAKARINVPFGASLTDVAVLPPGSQRDLVDPFAEKRSPWPKVIVVLILLWIAYAVLNRKGCIYDWTGGWCGTQRVTQGEKAKPEAVVPPPGGGVTGAQ
ncbi:MAG TPA: hypothetical protein PKM73_12085 [Verrucomicrobiota bacterium]|nr:hypothetical protein [Verrucomicrobiota bacterium]HNU50226.1 hypothetical protein [Verrucomicrobiota bacterium]